MNKPITTFHVSSLHRAASTARTHMKRHRHTTTSAILVTCTALCAAVPAAAQAQVIDPSQAQGLFSSFPVGLTISDSGAGEPVLIRAAGVESGRPSAWTAARFAAATWNHPDYSMGALTAGWVLPDMTSRVFGGISTGGDQMPSVDGEGELILGSHNWYSVSMTVDNSASAEPGSLLAAFLAANGRNPSGDIFTYYAHGGTAIHPSLPGTVRLESSREQLQLADVTPTVANRSITNFDYGMGVISIDPENRAGEIFTVRNSFYFTLTQAWVTEALQINSQYTLAGAAPTASTVYSMNWTGAAWEEPEIAFSHAELFGSFGSGLGPVEIDALTVDERTSGPRRVVFSLTPSSDGATVFDQILVYQRAYSPDVLCPTTALKVDDPVLGQTKVSAQAGLRPKGVTPGNPTGLPTNATGLCGIDPKEPYLTGPVVGLATTLHSPSAGTLGASAFRSCLPTQTEHEDVLHMQFSGMDFTPYELGFIVFCEENAPPADPTEYAMPFWIDTTVAKQNALDLAVPVAHALVGVNYRFRARCYGVNLSTMTWSQLRESWVVAVKI